MTTPSKIEAKGSSGGRKDQHPESKDKQRSRKYEDELPQSVEEAGALLGAAITRYAIPASLIPPPKGLHSGFATYGSSNQNKQGGQSSGGSSITGGYGSVPSSELFHRLAQLRSLLRSASTDVPLVAAPSLLAGVLMKLLAMSSQLAVGGSGSNSGATSSSSLSSSSSMSSAVDLNQKRTGIPPLLSTPVRFVPFSLSLYVLVIFHFTRHSNRESFRCSNSFIRCSMFRSDGFGSSVSFFATVLVMDYRAMQGSICLVSFGI